MDGELLRLATEHAARLALDVPLARTRAEHIRVSARANEAREIVLRLTEPSPL